MPENHQCCPCVTDIVERAAGRNAALIRLLRHAVYHAHEIARHGHTTSDWWTCAHEVCKEAQLLLKEPTAAMKAARSFVKSA